MQMRGFGEFKRTEGYWRKGCVIFQVDREVKALDRLQRELPLVDMFGPLDFVPRSFRAPNLAWPKLQSTLQPTVGLMSATDKHINNLRDPNLAVQVLLMSKAHRASLFLVEQWLRGMYPGLPIPYVSDGLRAHSVLRCEQYAVADFLPHCVRSGS